MIRIYVCGQSTLYDRYCVLRWDPISRIPRLPPPGDFPCLLRCGSGDLVFRTSTSSLCQPLRSYHTINTGIPGIYIHPVAEASTTVVLPQPFFVQPLCCGESYLYSSSSEGFQKEKRLQRHNFTSTLHFSIKLSFRLSLPPPLSPHWQNLRLSPTIRLTAASKTAPQTGCAIKISILSQPGGFSRILEITSRLSVGKLQKESAHSAKVTGHLSHHLKRNLSKFVFSWLN